MSLSTQLFAKKVTTKDFMQKFDKHYGQDVVVTVVSPDEIAQVAVNGIPANQAFAAEKVNGAYTYNFTFNASELSSTVTFQFK